MSDTFRLIRLVGDGDASGGGLPLPDAFTAVIQVLLDHGPAGHAALTDVLADALAYKAGRIQLIWRTWEDFTDDILAQLADAGLITEVYGDWQLTPEFRPGHRHLVIPEAAIGITVHTAETRKLVNGTARALIDARALEERLRQLGEPAGEALALVSEAVLLLTPEPPPLVKSARAKPRRGPEPRPTARELARSKYGYDGMPPQKGVQVFFGEDGLRPCVRCKRRLDPDNFSVYWENGHNAAYFLRGACVQCEADRAKARHKVQQ